MPQYYKSNDLRYFDSEISTAYVGDDGEINYINAMFYFSVEDFFVKEMGASVPDGFSIGIVDADTAWSPSNLAELNELFKSDGIEAVAANVGDYTAKDKNSVSFIKEYVGFDKNAVFVSGEIDNWGIGQVTPGNVSTSMIVYNKDRTPVAAGIVTIPLLK